MNRSTIIAVICLLVIGAAVGWMFLRPPSAAERSRRNAGWRKCAECGHEWYKDRSELIRESKSSPDKHSFNKCPECGAWRGMAAVDCPKCKVRFTAFTIVEDADGNLSFPKQRVCPHCGYRLGTDLSGDQHEPAEAE